MGNTEMFVSIITLTYKNFSKIRETISSVLIQDYSNVEYIISDDGSPEFPEQEIIRYIETNKPIGFRYRIIHHKQNMGTVRHLNLVYTEAKGDIIMPLACGDEFYSNNIVSEIVNRFYVKGSDIICGSRCLVNENGQEIRKMPRVTYLAKIKKLKTAEKQHKAFVLREFYEAASGSATYIKKELWERMGHFDENYRLWEDGPFFEKITSQGICIDFAMDLVVIRYLIGGVSTSNIVNPILKQDLDMFNCYLLNKINELGLSRFEKRRLKFFINKCENKKKIDIRYIDVILWKLKNLFYFRIVKLFNCILHC